MASTAPSRPLDARPTTVRHAGLHHLGQGLHIGCQRHQLRQLRIRRDAGHVRHFGHAARHQRHRASERRYQRPERLTEGGRLERFLRRASYEPIFGACRGEYHTSRYPARQATVSAPRRAAARCAGAPGAAAASDRRSREVPLHFHGVSTEDVAAIIARQGIPDADEE
jgi:hypothetical protein